MYRYNECLLYAISAPDMAEHPTTLHCMQAAETLADTGLWVLHGLLLGAGLQSNALNGALPEVADAGKPPSKLQLILYRPVPGMVSV